jgi:hypothetical protein
MRLFVVLTLIAVTSCSRPDTPQVRDAITSLEKVRTATEIGPTYEIYLNLLIEAKTKVDIASRLTSDLGLKSNLNSAIDNYSDAATVWQMKIHGQPLMLRQEPGATLLPKYSIQVDERGATVQYDEAMREIWHRADLRLEQVSLAIR